MKIDSCGNAATPGTHDESQFNSTKSEPDISSSGDLQISDDLQDVSPTNEIVKETSDWTDKQRETTRTRLVMWLVKLLGCSLLGTFTLTGVAAFSPKADKELIKNLVPQLITTQVTLLGVAFGYYFGNKED